MERLIVMKFGGTSLGTPARIRRAAHRVRLHLRAGQRVVVVVSAMGNTTDRILRWAEAVASGVVAPPEDRAPADRSLTPYDYGWAGREVDRALATGEELSAGLLAAALRAIGVPARSARGGEAGLEAVGPFGRGVLSGFDVQRLRRLLNAGSTPVVAGFQALRADGEAITLGRGGSDVTAVFLAGMLPAEACHIVTDVDGVYDADPRACPGAHRFSELSLAALVELTGSGARVVHPLAAQQAERFGIPLQVYSYRASPHSTGGTRIGPAVPHRAPLNGAVDAGRAGRSVSKSAAVGPTTGGLDEPVVVPVQASD